MRITIKRGLDLPVNGKPLQIIGQGRKPTQVALLGEDYPDLKPDMLVNPGERVKHGQPLFKDRGTGVNYVAPASGIVTEINRGLKRKLKSVIIRCDGDEATGFKAYKRSELTRLAADGIKKIMLDTGLWTALRTRPFNKTPNPETKPHSVFINAMDSRPLAADPKVIINTYSDDFFDGMSILSRLFDVNLFICAGPGSEPPHPDAANIKLTHFSGPHPAGLVGTHIHYLDPVGKHKTVWHLDYQDVIAIGNTFRNGRLYSSRIISLAGPPVREPRLIQVTSGTALEEIMTGELEEGKHRLISGSVLEGRYGDPLTSYLGRFHLQVSVLDEFQPLLPVQMAANRFSLHSLVPAWLKASSRHYHFDTAANGKTGPFIPLAGFEHVMPLDILPTPLLRALLAKDFDMAIALGCLELDEEDLALCGFVCCSKQDYTAPLRACLNSIDGALG